MKTNDEPTTHLTLAQSLIEQGLITNPRFIEAARLQSSLLSGGYYRLLGSILAELPKPRSSLNEQILFPSND